VDQVGYPTHALDTLPVDLHGILIQALHGKLYHLNSLKPVDLSVFLAVTGGSAQHANNYLDGIKFECKSTA